MEHSSQAMTGQSAGFAAESAPATGPFVVNLCASVAPLELKASSLPGLERYRLYQVRRVEDNRPRYRLRLGFFADEAATEAVLNAVRELYPAAFCVAAASDDLKHAPGFDSSTLGTPRPAATNTAATGTHQRPIPAAAPAASVSVPAPSPAPRPTAKPAAATLELLPDAGPATPPVKTFAAESTAAPFRVKAADPASLARTDSGLKLETESRSAASIAVPIEAPKLTDGPILIDSTQTLRMLTETELSDAAGQQWFAVQLAISEQPINLDTMPKLDIFSAFRLYSIAMTQQGKILHSLRLGFFREAVSAEAVSGYLKTFFSTPDVLRVSAAEQTRFADPPAPPVLHDTAANSSKVVPLHEARNRPGKTAAPVLSNAVTQVARSGAAPKAAPAATIKGKAAQANSRTASKAAPATAVARKTSAPVGKRPIARSGSLDDLLHEEARQVTLSESGIRRMEQKGSLLSRLVGKLTR